MNHNYRYATTRTIREEEINEVDDLLNNIVDGIDSSVSALEKSLKIIGNEEIEESQELDNLYGKLNDMHDTIKPFVTEKNINVLIKLIDSIKKFTK